MPEIFGTVHGRIGHLWRCLSRKYTNLFMPQYMLLCKKHLRSSLCKGRVALFPDSYLNLTKNFKKGGGEPGINLHAISWYDTFALTIKRHSRENRKVAAKYSHSQVVTTTRFLLYSYVGAPKCGCDFYLYAKVQR